MKQRRLPGFAGWIIRAVMVLVSINLAGCDFLEDTGCVSPGEVKVSWNPEQGIMDYTSFQLEGRSCWFPEFSNDNRMVEITNICPNKPVVARIKVNELCDRFECHARKYQVLVYYHLGDRFEGINKYDLVRTGPTALEVEIATIPELFSLLENPASISITVLIEVPFEWAIDWGMASIWSRDHVGSVDLQVNYTRFH